jgi:hypothetical protein
LLTLHHDTSARLHELTYTAALCRSYREDTTSRKREQSPAPTPAPDTADEQVIDLVRLLGEIESDGESADDTPIGPPSRA